MKNILTVLLLTCSMSAMAQHGSNHGRHHGYHGSHNRGGYGLVAPMIIGGVIGYSIARNYYDPYYGYVPPPVIYVQTPPPVLSAPNGYYWKEIIDPESGVRRIVAVPN
jgi:hypothetical protein